MPALEIDDTELASRVGDEVAASGRARIDSGLATSTVTPGSHTAGGVLDDAGNSGLGAGRDRGNQQENASCEQQQGKWRMGTSVQFADTETFRGSCRRQLL